LKNLIILNLKLYLNLSHPDFYPITKDLTPRIRNWRVGHVTSNTKDINFKIMSRLKL